MSETNTLAILTCRHIAQAIGFDTKNKNFLDLVEAVKKLVEEHEALKAKTSKKAR